MPLGACGRYNAAMPDRDELDRQWQVKEARLNRTAWWTCAIIAWIAICALPLFAVWVLTKIVKT
jgi:hypothetical protein